MNNQRTDGWTPERPTKPGRYWLTRRDEKPRIVEVTPGQFVWDYPETPWEEDLESQYFDGALWRPYVEPSDPHAVTDAPSLRSRVEALQRYKLGLIEGTLFTITRADDGNYLERSDVLALLDEVRQ